MKNICMTLFFCLFGTTLTMAQSKDEAAVAAAVENLRKTMIDPTKEALEDLAMKELTYGHSGGKIEDKAAFMEAFISGKSDFKSIELKDQTITVVGKTAIVRHKLFAETLDGGQPGTVKLAIMTVWQKSKGKWRLLARQAVKLPA